MYTAVKPAMTLAKPLWEPCSVHDKRERSQQLPSWQVVPRSPPRGAVFYGQTALGFISGGAQIAPSLETLHEAETNGRMNLRQPRGRHESGALTRGVVDDLMISSHLDRPRTKSGA